MTRHMATITTLLAAGALSMLLFAVKQQVQDLEDEIVSLNRSIVEDEQAIHVLKAEWSHLNDPQRLRDLSASHLGLKPVEPEQFGSVKNLTEQVAEVTATEHDDDFIKTVASALEDEKAGQ